MQIKTLLALSLPGLLGLALPLQAAENIEALKQKFIGDYELVSFYRFPAAGGQEDTGFIGRISYDKFGNMSALGMPADLPARSAASAEPVTAGFAYWGKVSWDIENSQVIHHVEGSPTRPDSVGGDNVRYYEHDGATLKLSVKDDDGRVVATLTWRKLR
jgi:hypothetical protein